MEQEIQTENEDAPVVAEALPEGQPTQELDLLAPVPAKYLPVLHKEQDEVPARAAYLPAEHSKHTDDELAPRVDEYFPGAQLSQTVVPGWAYCPPIQHTPASAEEEEPPTQLRHEVALGREYVPDPQFAQVAAEVALTAAEYFPAVQG